MQEKICGQLPDKAEVRDLVGAEAKPKEPEIPSLKVEEQPGNILQEEDRDAGDADRFYGGREISADIPSLTATISAVAASVSRHLGKSKCTSDASQRSLMTGRADCLRACAQLEG